MAMDSGSDVVSVDFAGVAVTRSFMDEFLGVLILRHGPEVLRRVELRNCTSCGLWRSLSAIATIPAWETRKCSYARLEAGRPRRWRPSRP